MRVSEIERHQHIHAPFEVSLLIWPSIEHVSSTATASWASAPCHLNDADAVDDDDDDVDDDIDDTDVIGADVPSDIAAQFNGHAAPNYV